MSGRMLVRMLMADTWDMVVFFRTFVTFVTLVSAPPDVSVLQIKHGDAIITDNLKNILYQGHFLSEIL